MCPRCSSKDTVKKNKNTKHTLGENIGKTHMQLKACVQDIQRSFATQKREKQLIKKWAKDLKGQFTKEDVLMVSKQ